MLIVPAILSQSSNQKLITSLSGEFQFYIQMLLPVQELIDFPWMLQVHVKSTIEFLSLFTEGCARRRIGAIDISSCSHAVLSVMVTNEDETNQHEVLTGKLNLVDLAGMVYIILTYIQFTWIIYYLDLCLLGVHEVVLGAFIQADSLSLHIKMSTLHLEGVNVWRCEAGGIFWECQVNG